MMKRVPGVSFQSDIGEYAKASLRASSSRTAVLRQRRRIRQAYYNGTRWWTGVPPGLTKRRRSPGTGKVDSQGIGGTLNIILKEGAS